MWAAQINDTKGSRTLYNFIYKMLSKIYNFSFICYYDTFTICISCPMSYLNVFVIKKYLFYIREYT